MPLNPYKRIPVRKRALYKNLHHVIRDIIDDWCHLPTGYAVWYALTDSQRAALTKKWINYLKVYLFTDDLRRMVVTACLGTTGVLTPETRPLYWWAVSFLFSGSEARFYTLWHQLYTGNKEQA
jgi:hypothetical protein